MKLLIVLNAIALSCAVVIRVENLAEKCDFSKCTVPDKSKLNVHLVPHTHDDVGWLKTVDQYYYGMRNDIQRGGVQYILDTVVEELIRDKERRFIYVETAFFWKWWQEQNEEQRAVVRELINTGQLEFINGGWCMNDEANTHYSAIIDQMAWGLRKLNDTFGKCGIPRIAWHIDPFGHSKEMASLFAQMNFDALYFAREDYQDHNIRATAKTLEHVWQASDDLGTTSDLFTGMMDKGYGPPAHMNWDMIGGQEDAVVDNPESEEYNVPMILKNFKKMVNSYTIHYATNNIMLPVGTDFQYQDAHIYYKNVDKLIKLANEAFGDEMKVFYSTPSCYTKAVHDSGMNFTSKIDDYFPYASDPHAYWSGYFTSRPTVKRMERVGNNMLQACKQIDTLATNQGSLEANLTVLREAMGVMQHHDAVAGTEKQHVTRDYEKLLQRGLDNCHGIITQSYTKLLAKDSRKEFQFPQEFCNNLNESVCWFSESSLNDFVITVYNPLGHPLDNHVMRIPVNPNLYYEVYSPEEKLVDAVLVPIPDFVRKMACRKSKASHVLTFTIDRIAPLGVVTYTVKQSKAEKSTSALPVKPITISEQFKLSSKDFDLIFNANGAATEIVLHTGQRVPFQNTFEYYKGHPGFNSNFEDRASGAYIFRPIGNQTYPVANLIQAELFLDEPSGVFEVHQTYSQYIQQIIRVDPKKDAVEFDFVVGPIPIEDKVGKEIITRYDTNLQNNRTFYTDANGRQILKRIVDYRPTWNYKVEEPISGNYYPVNSRIYIQDVNQDLQLTVMNDRSQGGSSIRDGGIELMVHRRLLYDDAFGVGEALNELMCDNTGLVMRGRHLLLLDTIANSASKHRPLGQQLFMEPIVSFSSITNDYFVRRESFLNRELPPNVHLLTLERWNFDRYLLRLEHFYQSVEDPKLGKPVKVSLENLFKPFNVTSMQELTLGANQDISATKNRLVFNYTPASKPVRHSSSQLESPLVVSLDPMQIRTYLITVQYNN